MQPYLQQNIKLTKEQLQLVGQWTLLMNNDSKTMFIHTLLCQKQYRFKADYEEWVGVPLPRQSFIHVHCRNYRWEHVQRFMTRAPYNSEEGICFRYRLHEHLIDQFIAAGESYLLSFSRFKEEGFYGAGGTPLPKLIKPFSDQPPTQIDLGYSIDWLVREKDRLATLSPNSESYQKDYRRYLHNLNCYQGMVERLVSVDYKKRQACYSQELIQPDAGLRFYELGGGLQGASKNFREFALCTSPVLNVDVVKCHATIAHLEMEKVGITSGLFDLLKGNLNIPNCRLTLQTIKTAVLAVINGAKLTKKLNNSYTIPRLVLEDAVVGQLSTAEKLVELKLLTDSLRAQQQAVKEWSRQLPKHARIPRISAALQRLEVEFLGALKKVSCNDQHDGALIDSKQPIPATNYLKVTPKPISSPDERYSTTLSDGITYDFIPFTTSGPANMVDVIMATGNRFAATNPHKNTFNPQKPTTASDSSSWFG